MLTHKQARQQCIYFLYLNSNVAELHCEGLEPEPTFNDDHIDFDKLCADWNESERESFVS